MVLRKSRSDGSLSGDPPRASFAKPGKRSRWRSSSPSELNDSNSSGGRNRNSHGGPKLSRWMSLQNRSSSILQDYFDFSSFSEKAEVRKSRSGASLPDIPRAKLRKSRSGSSLSDAPRTKPGRRGRSSSPSELNDSRGSNNLSSHGRSPRPSYAKPRNRGRSSSPSELNGSNRSGGDNRSSHGRTKVKRFGSLQSRTSAVNGMESFSRRRVRFSKENPKIVPTLSRGHFSDSESSSYWIHPDEMDRCIERNWGIVDAYEKYKLKKDPESSSGDFKRCTRGLESYIIERKKGKEIHLTKKKNAYTAVLLWGRDLSDEERSRRYQTVSKRCTKRAIEYGRRDALAAKRILAEDMMSGLQRIHRSQSDITPLTRNLQARPTTLGRPNSQNSASATPGNRGLAPKPKPPRRASSLTHDAMVLSRAKLQEDTRKSLSKVRLNDSTNSPPRSSGRRASAKSPSPSEQQRDAKENRGRPSKSNSHTTPPPILEEADEDDFHPLVADIPAPKSPVPTSQKVPYDHPFASPVISPSARALKSNKIIFSMLHRA